METPDKNETQLRTAETTDRKGSALIPRGFFSPKNLAEALQLAQSLAKADIVPAAFKGRPENILVAIGMGTELGLNPFQALQSIYVVNGRPCLWGDAVPGIIMASGEMEVFDESFDDKNMIATCRTKRKGNPIEVIRHFSKEDATRAGLWGKDTYKQYPRRMLQMRARSWALRDAYPDLLRGLQIREEVEDYTTTAEPYEEPLPPRKSEMGGAGLSAPAAASDGTAKDRPINDLERKELTELALDKGVPFPAIQARLKEKYGVESSAQLPLSKLADLKNWLVNGDEPPEL